MDTCHTYAAGYNLANNDEINNMLGIIDKEIALDRLKVIHINDSRHQLGTKKG